jgi:hypothetical protein
MNRIAKWATTVVVSAGVGLSGLVFTAAAAQADPWPGCHITDPVVWDWNICHTYWYVYPGQGNVANLIWDGDNPPPKPQAPPALINRDNCQQILGMLCPRV